MSCDEMFFVVFDPLELRLAELTSELRDCAVSELVHFQSPLGVQDFPAFLARIFGVSMSVDVMRKHTRCLECFAADWTGESFDRQVSLLVFLE